MQKPVFVDPRFHDAVILGLGGARVPAAESARESSIDFAGRLLAAGVAVAAFAPHRGATRIHTAAELSDLVATPAGGAADEEPPVPLTPALLHEAVDRIGASPRRCAVVADDEAGVNAARDGGFCLVIGVDRAAGERLRRGGADAVVADLADVTVRDDYRTISELADGEESFSEIAALVQSRTPAVLLDFDGTLSEIVSDPDAATLLPGAAATLESLAARCPVAVVSGRSLADIRERVGVAGAWYAGSHGFELVTPAGEHHENEAGVAATGALESGVAELRRRLEGIGGLLIEDKRFSVAVHYRNVAAERVDDVVAAVRIVGQHNGLRVTGGRMVTELRPDVDWGKGQTVRWILDQIDGGQLLPIFIGDDLTDEDAFDAIRDSGVGLVVRSAESGDRRTAGHYSLEAPAAVCRFLSRLVQQLAAES